MAGAAIRIGLPPLAAMFNSNGTAYAATAKAVTPRFVLWFNGNGIPERYWIPSETGADFEMTPCLAPLARLRNDIHVISGLDNPAARMPGPGQRSSQVDERRWCPATPFTGRGAGGPSIDQVIAAKIGNDSRASARCRSASRRNRSARASSAT